MLFVKIFNFIGYTNDTTCDIKVHMLRNKQSHRYSLCSVMLHAILFAYRMLNNMNVEHTVEYLDKEHSYKNSAKEVTFLLI